MTLLMTKNDYMFFSGKHSMGLTIQPGFSSSLIT